MNSNRDILNKFIKVIKDEFKDENWDYLDFIADRVMQNERATPFQNRVLLVADNLSDITKKHEDDLHYAILLIGEPVVWRKRQYKVVDEGDGTEPCSIVDRAQACIVYGTKGDLEINKGTYWDDIPDFEKEVLYEYTATII